MNTSDILASLRDVQEPIPPESTLPWLLLANLLIASFIVALLLYRWQRARSAWHREALDAIRSANQLPPAEARTSLAMTLRKVMLHLEGPQINGLSGDTWLERLDDRFNTNWFLTEGGRVFGDALYAPCSLSSEELTTLCDRLDSLVQSLPVTSQSQELSRKHASTASASASASASRT